MAPKDFWWQWPCSSARRANGDERQRERGRRRPRGREIPRTARACSATARRRRALDQRRDFIAEARTGNSARGRSPARRAPRTARAPQACARPPCAPHRPGPTARKVRPQHKRPRRSVARRRDAHAIAAGAQHFDCGAEILRLEIAVEGVGEQDDLARFVSPPLAEGDGRAAAHRSRPMSASAAPPRPRAIRMASGTSRGASAAGCGAPKSRRCARTAPPRPEACRAG